MGTITSFEKPGIHGFLHRPEGAVNGDGLVLTHGAGGNAASPLAVAHSVANHRVVITIAKMTNTWPMTTLVSVTR
jgi:predicted alpha/beta-hydrolase family hydrolase